jgi:hypothetical protein
MDPKIRELLVFARPDEEIECVLLLRPGHDPPFSVHTVARIGDVATCRVRVDEIVALRRHPSLLALKASRVYHGAAGLASTSPPPGRGGPLRRGLPGATGKGVVLACLDWGCDFAHANFRWPDGRTRLLALWDQRRPADSDANRYGYGTIHTRADIDRALAAPDPYAALGYHPADADPGGRGTHACHVLDIAAGNGRLPGSAVGMASETDLLFVHLAARDTPMLGDLGDSARVLHAVDFVRACAGAKPWVINMSLGRTGGDHSGLSLVERALDFVVEERPGRAICQSAGNYYSKHLHAEGVLRAGGVARLDWLVPANDRTANELEVWYSGRDTFALELRAPDGRAFAAPLGERTVIELDGRRVGCLYHRAHDSATGDHHIDLFLYPHAPAGRWQVELRGLDVPDGRYHAWIERDPSSASQSSFPAEQASPRSTLGTIANGYRSIVVGAYDPLSGALAPFSSSGPTRDGRSRPDVIAPGVDILAARSTPRGMAPGQAGQVLMSGTSMATPHIAGAIALLFEAAPRPLRIEETRALLLGNAVACDAHDPLRAGAGRLDLVRALAAARAMHGQEGTMTEQELVETEDARDEVSIALLYEDRTPMALADFQVVFGEARFSGRTDAHGCARIAVPPSAGETFRLFLVAFPERYVQEARP